MNILKIAAAIGALCVCGVAYGQAPDPRAGASTPVQVMNKTSNPVPVAGTMTGTVSVNKTQTTALLEMVGIPFNFHTTTPLDTSQCSSLRVVLKSVPSGPSLAFALTTPVGGTASGDAPYFSTLISSGGAGSEVVDVPPPLTNVVMGVSGTCPDCVLGIYCR